MAWRRAWHTRMKKQGDAVVVHGLRGRASNRKLPAKTQKQAGRGKLNAIRDRGSTFSSHLFAAPQACAFHKLQHNRFIAPDHGPD
jgi:hypothetical protein